jgi:hypothetical protein
MSSLAQRTGTGPRATLPSVATCRRQIPHHRVRPARPRPRQVPRDTVPSRATSAARHCSSHRIEKLSTELAQLRRRRDELHLRIHTAPDEITHDQLITLGRDINKIIDHGSDTERKRLCELLIAELKINTATTTATPILRVDLDAPAAAHTNNAPASKLAGARMPSSQGVRERGPVVELRGLEALTPTLPAPQMPYWSVSSNCGPCCFRRSTLAGHADPCRHRLCRSATSVPPPCPPGRS